MRKWKGSLQWLGLLFLMLLAWHLRGPYLYHFRPWDFAAFSGLAIFILLKIKRRLKDPFLPHWRKNEQRLLVLFILLTSLFSFSKEISFVYKKYVVLHTSPDKLQKWGSHFIVGYQNVSETENLISKGAIGGIFITQKNVKNKRYEEVKTQIRRFQEIRKQAGLPPLLITTDQEGGIVSRLSPPLTPQASLGSLVEQYPDSEKLRDAITRNASLQALELSNLGVNLNLSPVVDLKNKKEEMPFDAHTQVWKRAISEDPETVAHVALLYSQILEQHGVTPTLKHFPGLGKVKEDTHLVDARLETDLKTLEAQDWKPFRKVLEQTSAFLMVGHATLVAVDSENPVSVSQKVIQNVIRQQWGFKGTIITDDFTMGPIFSRPGGVGKATQDALNAGVDLILISYDEQLYYDAMYALIKNKGDSN